MTREEFQSLIIGSTVRHTDGTSGQVRMRGARWIMVAWMDSDESPRYYGIGAAVDQLTIVVDKSAIPRKVPVVTVIKRRRVQTTITTPRHWQDRD